MPTKEYFLEQINKELAAAELAMHTGNEGRARVCARRAAGQSITWFLSAQLPRAPGPGASGSALSDRPPLTPVPSEFASSGSKGWGVDALGQLKHLSEDSSFPQPVRDAAVRLTTKISDRFTYPFTTNPLEDARLIISHIASLME